MSFSRAQKPTLSQMINDFKQRFYSFKEYFESSQNSNQSSTNSSRLNSSMQSLNQQLKRIESEFNTASDAEVVECSDDFNLLQSEFEQFQKQFQTAFQVIYEDQSSNNYNQNNLYYDQQMIDEQTNELDYINNEVNEIIRTSKEINQISRQVDQEIQKQRIQLIKIDKVTADSAAKMEKGNNELNKAEEHQKGCTIC